MKEKNKIIIAWIILILSVILSLVISYLKFFTYAENPNIQEIPVENSSSLAINNALTEIVNLFNDSEEVKEYRNQNIDIRATLNQHSIFISYSKDGTTTYEFSYSNLLLGITIEQEKENIEKFNIIYKILIKAVQTRIGNESDIDTIITEFLENDALVEGISKKTMDKTIYYEMDITKKITN